MSVIFVGNPSDMHVLNNFDCDIKNYIEIPASGSSPIRENIFNQIKMTVSNYENKSNLLLILSAGGSISTWLGFKLFYYFNSLSIVDMGGVFAAYSSLNAFRKPWSKVYFDQLYKYAPEKLRGKKYFKNAYKDIVFEPKIKNSCLKKLDYIPKLNLIYKNEDFFDSELTKISFIENKIYDFDFIKSILKLSEKQNWHANHGPVVRLLEEATHSFLNLSKDKKVIFTNSGTSALEIACGLIQEKYFTSKNPMRWIVSSFNFFLLLLDLYLQVKKLIVIKVDFSLEELKRFHSINLMELFIQMFSVKVQIFKK